MMKEKKCELCNDAYVTHGYADELQPNTLCPGCTISFLYDKYRRNAPNGKGIPVAPNYGISLNTNHAIRPLSEEPAATFHQINRMTG